VAEVFSGFPPSGIAFLAGLAADNTKAYFDRNRGTYANDVAAPLRALVVAVGQRLRDRAGRDVCFDPTVGKSLFRINRDTRFSADKTSSPPRFPTWRSPSQPASAYPHPTRKTTPAATSYAATACTPQSSETIPGRWPNQSSPTPSSASSRPSRSCTAGWPTTSRPERRGQRAAGERVE
jgi:hypothetical protein